MHVPYFLKNRSIFGTFIYPLDIVKIFYSPVKNQKKSYVGYKAYTNSYYDEK